MMRQPTKFLASVFLLAAMPARAQTPPDAGQALRELERPAVRVARPAPALALPEEHVPQSDDQVRFVVSQIVLTGEEHLNLAFLSPHIASLSGKEMGLGDLQRAAQMLTQTLRDNGYVLARVMIPAQEIQNGVVRLQILEGRLGQIRTDNHSRIDSVRLDTLARELLKADVPLHSAALERTLLLAADLPGAGQVAGNLAPGDQVGTSDLTLYMAPGKRWEGEVMADNYGNRYTGQNRLNGRLDWNSPTGLGERVRLNLSATEEALYYGRAAYDLPIGSNGLRLGAALSRSHYTLGKEFTNLNAQGQADTAVLYGTYPILRSRRASLFIGASAEHRALKDHVGTTDTTTEKSADVLSVTLEGDWQDGLAGGAISRMRLGAWAGDISIDTPVARMMDSAGPRTQGRYLKRQAMISRLQALGQTTQVYASLQGQWTDKNLDSSEKFTLGGAYGVRAYPQGEGVGDQGKLATIELRQQLRSDLQASMFYDWGSLRINKLAYAAGSNSQTLAGYGLGVTWNPAAYFITATLAWRDRQAAVTAPDTSPRAWVQVGWRF